MNRNIVRTNETVRVLGNSYYAIYRMDFSNERYEMIKGSDYMRSKIPAEGDYNLLLSTMGELMRPEVFEEFKQSFFGREYQQTGFAANERLRRRFPETFWRRV